MSNQTRAVIFANGQIKDHATLLKLIHPDDMVVAADGGLHHCLKLGLSPDYLIGDFDSAESSEIQNVEKAGTHLIRHPARKDYTDLELALQHVKSLGVQQVLVLGGLGARWDQSLANLLLPASNHFIDIRTQIVDGDQEITVLNSGQRQEISGYPGEIVSLIPLSERVEGVATSGLEYPLDDETLYFGETRSISNVLSNNAASVYIKLGRLLVSIIHQPAG